MSFGPLELANYLMRKNSRRPEPAAVRAARAAAYVPPPERNRLTIVSGSRELAGLVGDAAPRAVSVFEAIATHNGSESSAPGRARVMVKSTPRPLVLVLSSNYLMRWCIERTPGASLRAVLLAGYGESTVTGADDVLVTSIGGFYAFRRGSQAFRHLEGAVLRTIGASIRRFEGAYSADEFQVGTD